MNTTHGAWRAMVASVMTVTVACTAVQATSPAVAETAREQVPPELQWSLRSTFNNYIGGPVAVGDGATWKDGSFTFSPSDTVWDASQQRLEAHYLGSIRYRGHCDGADPKDLESACALDLSMKNPTIVLDDDGSYVEAEVRSNQYPSGGVYAPAEPVRIATLATAGAKRQQTATGWQWSGVTATLTAEGNKMFSNFYKEKEALDPLQFSFDGDGPTLEPRKPGDLSLGPTWESPGRYDNTHQLFDGPALPNGKNSVLAVVASKGAYLLDDQLQRIAELPLNLAAHGAVHYNGHTGELLYGLPGEKQLYAVKVNAQGFSTPRVLAEARAEIMAISSNAAGQTVAIAHDFGQAQPHQAFLSVIDPAGKVSTTELPDTAELVGGELSKYSDSMYGPTYRTRDPLQMYPLADGTFVFDPQADISMADGTQHKEAMLRIDPAGTVEILQGSEVTGPVASLDSLSVNAAGTKLIRFNDFAGAYSRVHSLNYSDATVTPPNPLPSQSMVWEASAGSPSTAISP